MFILGVQKRSVCDIMKEWKRKKGVMLKMKTFNNLKEMQPYYNANTDTYEFAENQKRFDVEFDFNLNIDRNITARNIYARDINARDINAANITANNTNVCNINAWNINTWNINSWNINASNIETGDINAGDINAESIKAGDIKFYAVCFSYGTFVCNSIKGKLKNSRYFSLDSDVVINKKED